MSGQAAASRRAFRITSALCLWLGGCDDPLASSGPVKQGIVTDGTGFDGNIGAGDSRFDVREEFVSDVHRPDGDVLADSDALLDADEQLDGDTTATDIEATEVFELPDQIELPDQPELPDAPDVVEPVDVPDAIDAGTVPDLPDSPDTVDTVDTLDTDATKPDAIGPGDACTKSADCPGGHV
jgi:hypothetical protein